MEIIEIHNGKWRDLNFFTWTQRDLIVSSKENIWDKVLLSLRSSSALPRTVLSQYSTWATPLTSAPPQYYFCFHTVHCPFIYFVLDLRPFIRKLSSVVGFLSWEYPSFYALTIMYWFFRSGSPVLSTFYYGFFVLSLDGKCWDRKHSAYLIAITLLFELRFQAFNEMVRFPPF